MITKVFLLVQDVLDDGLLFAFELAEPEELLERFSRG
jgi:sorbitol-specific phosphotransferase system component IIA